MSLLKNLAESDVQSVLDEIEAANQESATTKMVPPKRAVADAATILGIVAALDDDATEKALNEHANRLDIYAAMYSFGLFHSTTDERFPFATVNEVEKAVSDGIVGDYAVIPGTRRAVALLKGDGPQKEYRKGNVELKGKEAPSAKWDSIEKLVKRSTSGVTSIIRKAAKISAKRVREENKNSDAEPEAEPAKKKPVKNSKGKKKAPPQRKQKAEKTEEAPVA